MLNAEQAVQKSEAINPNGLLGALYSSDEMIVEARKAIEKLPDYLSSKYGINFFFNTAICDIGYPSVRAGRKTWSADELYICSGADFETLYPDLYEENYLTKCKLQMMRLEAQDNNWRIGPSICGGLSLIHYKGFEVAPSLPYLKAFYEEHLAEYLKWGIHVMVSQNQEGELTIGDSHEYGMIHDPFDKNRINDLILTYLRKIAQFRNWKISESWHGIYPKRTDGGTELVLRPEQGVAIVNGLGGAGMTLSFGLADEIINKNLY